MTQALDVDICVIGAGSGGLSVAAGAVQMGASVALVEKGKMGGDCLNYGCVPSKALLAAGHAAEAVRRARRFGVTASAAAIDPAGVYGHVRETIAAIAPVDSVERFEGMGVKVIQAQGRFSEHRTVTADGVRITARRIVVATGSSAFVPPIPGLDRVPYLTNESLFDLSAVPEHLVVIGGGPVGIEMAQAHRHLGARVTVLEMASILPHDDPELVAPLRRRLIEDGIDVREGVTVTGVEKAGNGVAVVIAGDGAETRVDGTHVLVAAGRRPTVDGLDLDKAGIDFDAKGIKVNARLRTTNRRVYAVGDVAGGYQLTHMANHHAGIIIRNILFRLPSRIEARVVPWVTYTAPELAQVGPTEAAARRDGADIRILRWPFADNDRARAEGDIDGLVKVVTTPRGRIVGAGIVGPRAGELIQTWVLAMAEGLKIGAVAKMIVPYPTLGEVNKRAAGSFFTPMLFGERTRRLVRFLRRFG
jgi:pyruvate/2-oxoglutarate dehydrogenase complex dihydrolipoamide dehydrogenase (E3) component